MAPVGGRTLILGASGFVGNALLRTLGERAVGTYRGRPVERAVRFDAKTDSLKHLLAAVGSGISTIYMLQGAVNPEACARDPAGTAAINVAGMRRLISEALDRDILPIFISSDYVFDGTYGLRTEEHPQCPNTEYGRQKAAVEQWLGGVDAPWIVARLSKVVSGDISSHSVIGQLVPEIRRGSVLRMATDQFFSPAHAEDVALALAALPGLGVRGIINVAGPQPWSRYDLTGLLLAAARERAPSLRARLLPCRLHDLPFLERRPLDTSLSTERLSSLLPHRFRSMESVCEEAAEAAFGPAKV